VFSLFLRSIVEANPTRRAVEIILTGRERERERERELDCLATKFRLHAVNNLLYVHSTKSVFQEQMLVQLCILGNTDCSGSTYTISKVRCKTERPTFEAAFRCEYCTYWFWRNSKNGAELYIATLIYLIHGPCSYKVMLLRVLQEIRVPFILWAIHNVMCFQRNYLQNINKSSDTPPNGL